MRRTLKAALGIQKKKNRTQTKQNKIKWKKKDGEKLMAFRLYRNRWYRIVQFLLANCSFAQLLAHNKKKSIEVANSVVFFFYCNLNSLAHLLLGYTECWLLTRERWNIHARNTFGWGVCVWMKEHPASIYDCKRKNFLHLFMSFNVVPLLLLLVPIGNLLWEWNLWPINFFCIFSQMW